MVGDLTAREKALISMTVEFMRQQFAEMLEGMAADAPPDVVLPVCKTLAIAAKVARDLNTEDYPVGRAS